MKNKRTLVLGGSTKPERYSNMAIRKLVDHGHSVVAVGLRPGTVDGTPIRTDLPRGEELHTVTLYMNADNQAAWEERLLAAAPKRIIFNPGAENPRFAQLAEQQGIEVVEGCTLVMLSTGQF